MADEIYALFREDLINQIIGKWMKSAELGELSVLEPKWRTELKAKKTHELVKISESLEKKKE